MYRDGGEIKIEYMYINVIKGYINDYGNLQIKLRLIYILRYKQLIIFRVKWIHGYIYRGLGVGT